MADQYSTDRLTFDSQEFILNHMVEYESQDLDAVFHALSDPTRRAMLHRLTAGEHTVSELAEPFAMSLAAASKHIKVLERAGLLQRTVDGRTHRCRLDGQPMQSAIKWMRRYESFWNERLDVLESRLIAEDEIAAKSNRSEDGNTKRKKRSKR